MRDPVLNRAVRLASEHLDDLTIYEIVDLVGVETIAEFNYDFEDAKNHAFDRLADLYYDALVLEGTAGG